MMRKLLQSFLKYFILLLSIGSQVNHLINIYSIKSVRIRSYYGPCFSGFGLNTE